MTSKQLPIFETYGNYASLNYGVNALRFVLGDMFIWFSYKTPVAFRTPTTGLVVRKNDWGATTGKHLNWIDGGGSNKRNRISGAGFEQQLLDTIA